MIDFIVEHFNMIFFMVAMAALYVVMYCGLLYNIDKAITAKQEWWDDLIDRAKELIYSYENYKEDIRGLKWVHLFFALVTGMALAIGTLMLQKKMLEGDEEALFLFTLRTNPFYYVAGRIIIYTIIVYCAGYPIRLIRDRIKKKRGTK